MKTLKFNLSIIIIFVVLLFLAGAMSSCGTKNNKAENETEESDHLDKDSTKVDEHNEDENHHDEGEGTSETVMWMPDGQPFSGKLKLVQGDEQQLSPTITTESDGLKVLNLTLSGSKVILLFDGTFENLGANLQFKTHGFQGEIALVHHYADASNYDYVSLNNSSMQLGRIENGKNNVMDKKDKKMPNDWVTLTISAAGEHYKGLLNEELVNHGHGETRAAGQVGVVFQGKGQVMLKMMEVMKLTE